MTRDDFRRHQKALCFSGAPNKGQGVRARYGCPCCRATSDLADFKRFARRQAKVAFRRDTEALIEEQLDDRGYELDWDEYDWRLEHSWLGFDWWDHEAFSPEGQHLTYTIFEARFA